jgi:hypothetical protein
VAGNVAVFPRHSGFDSMRVVGGMTVLIRGVGWLLLALALAAIVQDGLSWWSEGAFRLLALGDVWSRLDYESLNGAQSFVTGQVSSRLWAWIAMPVLQLPALPALLVLGFLCLWAGQPGNQRREQPSIVSSRPRRRRRSGLL